MNSLLNVLNIGQEFNVGHFEVPGGPPEERNTGQLYKCLLICRRQKLGNIISILSK